MANVSGISAPPPPPPPDSPPPVSYGQVRGISASPGFQGPPPGIDPNVAAIKTITFSRHGTG